MVLPGKGMGWMEFFKALKTEWKRDDVSDVAGALTFRAILALFPFLLFLVSLAGIIINPEQAQVLIQQLSKVAPQDVTNILSERINSLAESNPVGLLTAGGVGAVWAASSGVVALMDALNTAYGVEEKRPFWKLRGIALLVTLGGAVLAIVAALAVVVTPVVADRLGAAGTVLTWLRLPLAGLLMMLLWAVLYYVLPDVKQTFRFITPGSVVGVIIWLLASWGFSKYVANFGNYNVNYGAIGGVIVLLLWMWISSQVILLGAEINAILEHRSPDGKAPGKKRMDEGQGLTATKGELEEGGARLPGSRAFRPAPSPRTEQPVRGSTRPPKLGQTPLAAAARWAAGLGLGLYLVRRNTAR